MHDIVVIDYEMGNIGSIVNMINKAGGTATVTDDVDLIYNARRLLLPGVGAFDAGMTHLREKKLDEAIINVVTRKKTPLLGICLGMQLLLDASEEGTSKGLGLIQGGSKKFMPVDNRLKVPHMGWNTVSFEAESRLTTGLSENRFYFVHSFYVTCADKRDTLGTTRYINDFASVIQKDNIYGAQFHPEKSHKFGLKLFQNFLTI